MATGSCLYVDKKARLYLLKVQNNNMYSFLICNLLFGYDSVISPSFIFACQLKQWKIYMQYGDFPCTCSCSLTYSFRVISMSAVLSMSPYYGVCIHKYQDSCCKRMMLHHQALGTVPDLFYSWFKL